MESLSGLVLIMGIVAVAAIAIAADYFNSR